MPHNVNFSKVKGISEITINPQGWVNPLIIEYGKSDYGVTPSIFWKVKGTLHTFVMPTVRLEYLSSGNYAEHFEKVIKGFREEYMGWKDDGFKVQWQQHYREQYKKFII